MTEKRYSSPVLIEKLDHLYGTKQEMEKIVLRESKDAEVFLEEMERWRKLSDQADMSFK